MTDKNYIADFGSAENVNDIIEKNISTWIENAIFENK